MLFYILAGVLFIALVVFLVYAAKNWHWLHVTAVILVYLTATTGFYCAGFVLKTRKAIVKEFADAKLAAETEEQRFLDKLYGAQPNPNGGFGEGSLKGEVAKYNLLTTGKGRSWDDAVLQARDENQVVFDIPLPAAAPAEDGMAPPAEAAPPAGEPVDSTGMYPSVGSLIYAFQVSSFTIGEGNQVGVPGMYLGSYRVTAVNGTQVTTVPQLAMTSDVRVGDAISLFEKPPVDTHDVMVAALGFGAEDKPSIEEFREKFQATFPPDMFGMDDASTVYQEMVDEFSFDGRPVTEIDQWLNSQGRPSLNPDAEEVLVESQVQMDLEESVDGTQDMITSGVFDTLGRANDPELQLGATAKVPKAKEGDDTDVILIDEPTASLGYVRQDGTQVQSWEETGKTQSIRRLFSRRIRDYTSEIEQLDFDTDVVQRRVSEYARYDASLKASLADAEVQQVLRDSKISDLTQDQQSLRADLQLANGYLEQLESRLGQLKQEIRDSYLQISYLHGQSLEQAAAWAVGQ
jgi:hypothetical protein